MQLPKSMKIHNVFYLNFFQKTLTYPLTNQINKPLPLLIINNKKEWEVEHILDARSYHGKFHYRVKWIDWDEKREWHDVEEFENITEIVGDFYSLYPEKLCSGKLVVRKTVQKKNRELGIFFWLHSQGTLRLNKGVIAGRETVATVLSATINYLCQNLALLRTMADEIWSAVFVEADPTMGILSQLPYLTAVLKECLCICSPTPPSFPRVVPSNDALGCWLPGGASLIHLFASLSDAHARDIA